MKSVIAKRYAKAFIGLIADNAMLDQVATDLNQLSEAYQSNLELQHFIHEPKFQNAVKVKGVGQISAEMGLAQSVQKFSRFLTSKGRFELIAQVATSFDQLSQERQGKGRAQVITSVEMKASQSKALAQQLSAYTQKDISLEVTVDPTILGGAITQIGSLVLDGSVKTQLSQIRKTISRVTN